MKNILRFAVAGVLAAGYATAQAQTGPLPTSGSSDLWLFVSDQSAGTTFAEDTGVSINSIMGSTFTANAKLSTAISANFTVSATTALSNYIAAAKTAGQSLEYAVAGVQFSTAGANDSSNYTPGVNIAVFDEPSGASADSKVKGLSEGANLQSINQGLDGDLENLAAGYTTGGTVYSIAAGAVWGSGTGNQAGSTDLYGNALDQSGIALGTATTLYGVTGNSSPGQVQSYKLGTNLTLDGSGNLSVVNSVPLPAAVWLFGSGLLGLIGVGRRRAAAV